VTTSSRLPALLAVAAVCVPIAGCGDDDEGDRIPPAKVERLNTQLDVAQQHVADGLCEEASTAVTQARATVDTLDDDGVGADVQDALGDGVDNLGDLVRQECQGEDEEETVPETTPTETIPPETTPTETTPTETTPTETTEPTPIEPEPLPGEEEEPDESDGGAQFDPDASLPPGQAKKEDGD
jgi:hypothetical protein